MSLLWYMNKFDGYWFIAMALANVVKKNGILIMKGRWNNIKSEDMTVDK